MRGGSGAARNQGNGLPRAERDAPGGTPWHAIEPEEAAARLGTARDGLTESESLRRLDECGPNLLRRGEGRAVLPILAGQFRSPLVYVLMASAAIAMTIGKETDGLVVLAVVILNALIGFLQEFRAGKAIEALSRMVPDTATVVRGGERHLVEASLLVPGDVILFEPGDKVPADARLLDGRSLQANEAALTGESAPVAKTADALPERTPMADRHNLVYSGTLIVSGSGTGVVVATADRTELGRISAMLREADPLATPLTRQLARIGRWMAAGILAVSALLLPLGLLRGFPPGDALLVAVTLAVAAIPEGLPAVVTIALAVGVQRMARRRAIVRRLPAAETLGSTTVICSDKTGTLTRSEMTVQQIRTARAAYEVEGVGYAPNGSFIADGVPLPGAPGELAAALRAAALCGDAELHQDDGGWSVEGDPTEGALLVAARKAGLHPEELRETWPRLDAVPFDSERRYMATLHGTWQGEAVIFLKGAPEAVVARCTAPATDGLREPLARAEEMASQGMRLLAVAERTLGAPCARLDEADLEGGFTLLGLFGIIDPPRPEAIAAVERCRQAGVAVKMITGDHRATAIVIGRQLGLAPPGQEGVTGEEIEAADDERLAGMALRESVFARVAPEHKLRLVRALQARGQVVAMTGDGVNDGPALRQADIGVAMGITGTAVSKEAADIVLADDNFASIAAAVEEGRRVYDNLVKALAFILPTNFGLALILIVAVSAFPVADGHPLLPMTPTQTLWINLVAAVTLALPLAFEVLEPAAMRRPPRDPAAPILDAFLLQRCVLVALVMAAGAVGLFLYEYNLQTGRGVARSLALREAQTMAVLTTVLLQALYLLHCRSLRGPLGSVGFRSNPWIYAGILVLLLLQAAFVYLPVMNRVFGTAPLAPEEIARSVLVALVVLPVISIEKRLRRARGRPG